MSYETSFLTSLAQVSSRNYTYKYCKSALQDRQSQAGSTSYCYLYFSLPLVLCDLGSVSLLYDFVCRPSMWTLMREEMEDLRTLSYNLTALLYLLAMATIGMQT